MTFHYPHLAQCSQNDQTSEGQVSPNTHFLTKARPAPDVTSQHTHRNRQIIALQTQYATAIAPRSKPCKRCTYSEMQIIWHREQLCEHYAPPQQTDLCGSWI